MLDKLLNTTAGAGAFLVLAVAAHQVLKSQTDSQTDVTEHADARAQSRTRGHDYEAHALPQLSVFYPGLRLHPHIQAGTSMEGTRYMQPSGREGGAVAGKTVTWNTGSVRVPDAMLGDSLLIELKCPNPYLTLKSGDGWANKANDQFAGQALAFLSWAAEDPQREVIYGFCGLIPYWQRELLVQIAAATGTQAQLNMQQGYYSAGFEAARRMGAGGTDAKMTMLNASSPTAYDRESD